MYGLIGILALVACVYHIVQLIRGKKLEGVELFLVILGDVIVLMAMVGLFVQTT